MTDNNTSDPKDFSDPFGKNFSPISHVSIERLCEMDNDLRKTTIQNISIDAMAKHVKKTLDKYTPQEIATHMANLSVISDRTNLNQAPHHLMLGQRRFFYDEVIKFKLEQDDKDKWICSNCPGNVWTMEEADDRTIRKLKKCVFLMEEVPEDLDGKLRNCPFF